MDNYRTSFERDGFVLLDKYLTDEESNLLGVFADRAYNLDSKYNLANPIK